MKSGTVVGGLIERPVAKETSKVPFCFILTNYRSEGIIV